MHRKTSHWKGRVIWKMECRNTGNNREVTWPGDSRESICRERKKTRPRQKQKQKQSYLGGRANWPWWWMTSQSTWRPGQRAADELSRCLPSSHSGGCVCDDGSTRSHEPALAAIWTTNHFIGFWSKKVFVWIIVSKNCGFIFFKYIVRIDFFRLSF